MQDASAIELIKTKYHSLVPLMDERMRRQWAASEATAYGWGGIQAIAQATGLSPTTIRKGQSELAERAAEPEIAITTRLRRPGAGRIRKTEEHPELIEALDKLVDPVTRGDPESPLRWTCKSTAALARELTTRKRKVSENTVRRLLKSAGYSLQGN